MLTLSYGFLKPEDRDTGDEFFPAIAADMQQLNDHTHNGTDSAPLSSQSQTILAADWVAAAIGGGLYRQLVTLPTGLSYDTIDMWFKLSSGEIIFPTIEKDSDTTYYIYTNDNSQEYTAYYR